MCFFFLFFVCHLKGQRRESRPLKLYNNNNNHNNNNNLIQIHPERHVWSGQLNEEQWMHQRWLLWMSSLQIPPLLSFPAACVRMCKGGSAFLFITPFCPLSLLTHQLIWQSTPSVSVFHCEAAASEEGRNKFRNSLRWKTAATVCLVRRRKCCMCLSFCMCCAYVCMCVCVY